MCATQGSRSSPKPLTPKAGIESKDANFVS